MRKRQGNYPPFCVLMEMFDFLSMILIFAWYRASLSFRKARPYPDLNLMMFKRYFWAISFLLFYTIDVRTQQEGQPLIDSLQFQLQKTADNRGRERILSAISYEMKNIHPDEGIKLGVDALKLAENLDDLYGAGFDMGQAGKRTGEGNHIFLHTGVRP